MFIWIICWILPAHLSVPLLRKKNTRKNPKQNVTQHHHNQLEWKANGACLYLQINLIYFLIAYKLLYFKYIFPSLFLSFWLTEEEKKKLVFSCSLQAFESNIEKANADYVLSTYY